MNVRHGRDGRMGYRWLCKPYVGSAYQTGDLLVRLVREKNKKKKTNVRNGRDGRMDTGGCVPHYLTLIMLSEARKKS